MTTNASWDTDALPEGEDKKRAVREMFDGMLVTAAEFPEGVDELPLAAAS